MAKVSTRVFKIFPIIKIKTIQDTRISKIEKTMGHVENCLGG
jgi:hypothetical protein